MGSSLFRKDEDESLVLFGDLHRHESERDVNLLEPMYSVELAAIHQGQGYMFKLPSGKREFKTEGEKHDYDWLKTPPATPLFPSLEMEANSSHMVFQRELPIIRPLQPSTFLGKQEAAATARPDTASKKHLIKRAPTLSKQQNSANVMDKRSSYTPFTNRRHSTAPATTTTTATATTKAGKKSSDKKAAASQGSTNAVKKAANSDKKSKDPALGIGDAKVGSGKTRRLPCPSAAARGSNKEQQLDSTKNISTATGRAQTGSVSASAKGGRATVVAAKQRPKFRSNAKQGS